VIKTKTKRPIVFFAALLCSFFAATLAMGSDDCLECHGDMDAVGEELFIDVAIFDSTAHGEMGCDSCHEDVSEEHPDDGLIPSKAACQDCHDEISSDYSGSTHQANAQCGDCHNPHQSHGATQVSGYDMNLQCTGCHEISEMITVHDEWLPQTDLHMTSVPCISCHTGSPDYVITLYISNRDTVGEQGNFELAEYEILKSMTGDKSVQSLVDLDGDNAVSLDELRSFNLNLANQHLRLKGMMTPEQVSHDFNTLDNRFDCSFCHASGPEAMQTSFLSLPNETGTFDRMDVEQGAILDILYGTPDFYITGTTRSKGMDILGIVIVLCGTIMPIGHGTLRLLTRKNRK
jgi:predicted CXXCH cytochrome family protein